MSRSVSVWLFRFFMVATLPVFFPIIVLAIAGREFRHAAHVTWLGAKMELASFAHMLRDPPIKGGDRA